MNTDNALLRWTIEDATHSAGPGRKLHNTAARWFWTGFLVSSALWGIGYAVSATVL